MKFKRIIVYFLIAIVLCGSLSASAYGFKVSEEDCYLSNNHYNSTDNDCIKETKDSQSTRALIDGCDTRTQINTAAKLSTLLDNNGGHTIKFVARYLQNGNEEDPKKITPTELKLLSSRSIPIVSLYQLSGDKLSDFTYQEGIDNATDAISCATAIDQPSGKPIYFCVDYWPDDSELNIILNYFNAINSVFSKSSTNPKGYKLGAYGCSTVLRMLRTSYPSIKTMLCGTTNCYDGTYFTSWDIKQGSQILIGSGANIMYICVDRAYSTSYGAWGHEHSYPVRWSNYNNPAQHRRKCIYCSKYQYQNHVQDLTVRGASFANIPGQ